MKSTRSLITLLAITSVTAAIAGDNRWFAGKYRPAATTSASVSTESQKMKDCRQCKGCTKGSEKTTPPTVRDTGPAFTDYMS